jgi:hypothetical protein
MVAVHVYDRAVGQVVESASNRRRSGIIDYAKNCSLGERAAADIEIRAPLFIVIPIADTWSAVAAALSRSAL